MYFSHPILYVKAVKGMQRSFKFSTNCALDIYLINSKLIKISLTKLFQYVIILWLRQDVPLFSYLPVFEIREA